MPNPLPASVAGLVPILFGHAAFQHLNAACQLGLHQLLHENPGISAGEIGRQLELSDRAVGILLLGTTALGLTTRRDGVYHNGSVIEDIFDAGSWTIFRDLVDFEAGIAYLSHSDYVESLQSGTNAGLRWFPGTEANLYQRLQHSPPLMELFYRSMNSWSRVANSILTGSDWFSGCKHVLDLGGGDGVNAIALTLADPDLVVSVLDLEGSVRIARTRADEAGVGSRVHTLAGDMFVARYPPEIDCVLLANQVSIWSPAENLRLIARAHEGLGDGGRVVIFSEFVNDTLDGPLYAALDNVYFATLPTRDSRLYPASECVDWARSAGFRDVRWCPGETWTPHGAVVGVK